MKRLYSLLLAVPLGACMSSGIGAPTVTSETDPLRPTTRPLVASLQPASRPADTELVSMTVTSLVDASTKTYSVRPYGYGVRVRESDGCAWTRALDWFSPSDSWANCGTSRNWHTAQARVRELEPLYPLKIGSVGRYERRAVSHTGRSYVRETRCEVTDAVEVLRPGQTATPAYVVECDDTKRRRTTWYAPGIGPVAYHEVHRRKGLEEAWVRSDL
ncbi:MAG: hypothetical protein QNJ92_13160 [Alphaproteobacteria bacterium]|nr:hypothetical protein [Alphaproteobacteria bacterium]